MHITHPRRTPASMSAPSQWFHTWRQIEMLMTDDRQEIRTIYKKSLNIIDKAAGAGTVTAQAKFTDFTESKCRHWL